MRTTPVPLPRSRDDRAAHCTPGRSGDLTPLLAPRSVAVAGTSWGHGGVAHEVLRGLRDYGFRGPLYAVNRSGRPVCGVPGYRRVRDVRGPIDLIVVATPVDQAAEVVAAAGVAGVRAAAVLSSPEVRGATRAGQNGLDLGHTARRYGIQLIGPDSLGVLITDPRVRLNAGLAAVRPAPGGLAVLVRSGTVGLAVLDQAVRTCCGISAFVSLGDNGSVAPHHVLDQWYDDSVTRVVAVHLGSRSELERLQPALRALARRKPVLCVDSGTAVLPPAVSASGMLRTVDTEDLIAAARMLDGQPLPAGGRLAIIGNAGGLTALAAQAARAYGFRLVTLSRATRAELPSVNGVAGRDNPVDLGVAAAPALLADAAETVASSGEADILMMMLVATRANVPAGIMTALGRVVDDHPSLAAAAVFTGGADDRASIGTRQVPVFRQPEQAVRALAHARGYAAWARTAVEPSVRRSGPDVNCTP